MTIDGIFVTTGMMVEYLAYGITIIGIAFLFYLTRSK